MIRLFVITCLLAIVARPTVSSPQEAEAAADKATAENAEQPEAPPKPLAQQPYKIRLSVSVATHPARDQVFRDRLLKQLRRSVRRTWGGMWQAEVLMNEDIHSALTIDRLTPEEMSKRFADTYDKVISVAIDPRTLNISAREWDWRSNTLNVTATRRAYDEADVAPSVIRLLQTVFEPVLTFERSEGDFIEMYLKAGEYPAPDPAARQVRVGDVLRPFVRYFNKKKRSVVDKIQDQTLTYLIVSSVDRGRVAGTLISGVPTVFGKKARRAEMFALRRRPRFDHTRLRLVLRPNPDKPLLCHRVNVVDKLKYRDKERTTPLDLISDRYGKVRVPVGEQPTYWIYVYSGKLLLARIPYAPGLVEEETIYMPDDSMRLLVEGEVDLLKGELIDLVARRAVHMSAAVAYAKQAKGEAVKAEVAALEALPGLDEFKTKITNFERPAIDKAVAVGNRVSRGRIKKVCQEIRNVLNNFFDPEKMKQFKDRLDQIYGDNAPPDDA